MAKSHSTTIDDSQRQTSDSSSRGGTQDTTRLEPHVCFFHSIFYSNSIDNVSSFRHLMTAHWANLGQQRSTTANKGQWQPMTANEGHPGPAMATQGPGQQKAKAGPQRTTMANAGPLPCRLMNWPWGARDVTSRAPGMFFWSLSHILCY